MKAMAAMAFAALLTSGIAACSSDDDVVEEPAPLTANKPMLGDDMTKDEFMYNWENCQTVKIAGIQDEVNCPWYGASAQNIPDYVRFDIKKENGWEMAFCELNDPNAMRTRMFGLYNKYTGILRIFHYIDNPTGYGSELVYLVSANESVDNNKYPLYHSMEFAVPANHQYGKTLFELFGVPLEAKGYTRSPSTGTASTSTSRATPPQAPTGAREWHSRDTSPYSLLQAPPQTSLSPARS